MGKLVDKFRKEAEAAAEKNSEIDVDEYILFQLDDVWREEIDEYGLALGYDITSDAIPIIEKCIEEKDRTALDKWINEQLDNMTDGEIW